MREIKFRAWLPGVNVLTTLNSEEIDLMIEEGNPVMQFTGLRDKNGVEIYEGDIIEEGQGNGAVEWLERRAAFGYLTDTATIQLYGFCGEVIGNIYENPELLEK